ncbi:MAG: hypothetical protein V9F04_10185 [Dermatophilaceae bacterium]
MSIFTASTGWTPKSDWTAGADEEGLGDAVTGDDDDEAVAAEDVDAEDDVVAGEGAAGEDPQAATLTEPTQMAVARTMW